MQREGKLVLPRQVAKGRKELDYQKDMIIEKILDNFDAVSDHERARSQCKGNKGYLNEAEEQLELFPWFDLVTGAESNLRERSKAQE